MKETRKPLIDRFLKNEHYKKYFYNTGWALAEKVVRFVALFCVGIIVPRFLGPEKYGTFSLALSTIAVYASIASLGLGDIIIREFIRHPEKED